jgi:hypothetical protein
MPVAPVLEALVGNTIIVTYFLRPKIFIFRHTEYIYELHSPWHEGLHETPTIDGSEGLAGLWIGPFLSTVWPTVLAGCTE